MLTSPVLDAEEVAEVVSHEGRNLLQVVGADAGGQQGLVGIPVGGVHQEQALVVPDGLGEAGGPFPEQDVPEARGWLAW